MNKKKRSVCAVLTATAVLTMGAASVYADTAATDGTLDQMRKGSGIRMFAAGSETEKVSTMTSEQMQALMTETNEQLKAALVTLVEDGTISQEIADQMSQRQGMFKIGERTALEDGERPERTDATLKMERPEKPDMKMKFENAGKARIELTDEQAKAIQEAMQNAHKAAADKLVADGVITQEQADEIASMHVMHVKQEKQLTEQE